MVILVSDKINYRLKHSVLYILSLEAYNYYTW